MTCPTHVPVVTEGPEGDYMRTDCRACGMTLPREGFEEILPEVAVENVDAPAPRSRRRKAAAAE